MSPFWQSLAIITVAEMADKTQLASLAFATRFPAGIVFGAILVATLLVNLLSVTVGALLGFALPTFWVALAAGVAFIGFGVWTLRGEAAHEAEPAKPARFGPFLTVAVTFFLAELGDKTMLATITLASQHQSVVPVWLGASLGMVIANGIAIAGGMVAGKRLPERAMRLGAAALFIITGLWTIGGAFL